MKLPQGFLLSAANCGLRKERLDLGLIQCDDFYKAIGFFTTNANPAYSVLISKKNIGNPIKAILVNSGNANCFSHTNGLKDTESICQNLAQHLNVKSKNILIASTGIIGKKMPKEKIITALPQLINTLGNNIDNFASSILTTDTFKKISYQEIPTNNGTGVILGCTKGAGMISPKMATMLCFILTDVKIPDGLMRKFAKKSIEKSFNSITIDGCMSTNDTVFILSSGKITLNNKELAIFFQKLDKTCLDLAKMIVKDGEGATKFIQIDVFGAKNETQAKTAGMFIANSNLFKCALYGEDFNWGRIIAALGAAGIAANSKTIIKTTPLNKKDIIITVKLNQGKASSTIYTSDLTPEYVKINADYN